MATKRTPDQIRQQLDLCESRIAIAEARAQTAEQRASVAAFKSFNAKHKHAEHTVKAFRFNMGLN